MPRLNQLLNRAQPTQDEVHILRGIARPWTWLRTAALPAPAHSCAVPLPQRQQKG
jgi:tRNA C32,U32 (ribose-2'-O)-methylase TrmJ